MLGFYDDFKVTKLQASAPSTAASLRDAAAWWDLLLDEEKSQTPSTRTKFLSSWEVSSYDGDPMLFALLPTSERVESITQELTDVLRSARVAHGRLLTLRGKLIHLFSVMTGRLGRSLTAYLSQVIAEEADVLSLDACRELSWVQALISMQAWTIVELSMPRPAVTVVSDASWAGGCARLCWLVFHPATAPWSCVSEIPGTFLSRCVPRDTQIFMAELLAAVFPLWLSPPLFLDAAVSIFMDNVVRLSMVAPRHGTFRTCHWLYFAVFRQSLRSRT